MKISKLFFNIQVIFYFFHIFFNYIINQQFSLHSILLIFIHHFILGSYLIVIMN